MKDQALKNDLLLRAMRRERTERTPVWLMRQAGRFDPQYRAIKDKLDMPLERMFRTPDVATEISLLPRRLGVDAIIFYQDILTPLAPMGADFVFRPGPILQSPVRCTADIDALRSYDPATELGFVSETLRQVRDELDGSLPLLGFAGAPLTLAFFMIEGRSPGADPSHVRAMMRDEPALLHRLLDKLTDMTVDYLTLQIDAGADAVQLFESIADLLSPAQYREFAHPYHVKIFASLARRAPTILFAKEQPALDLMAESGADVLSVGSCVDLAQARRRWGHAVAFQGNVNNRLLVDGTPEQIDEAVRQCVRAGAHHGHILNLNHGLLKKTPFENVCRLIETCKSISAGASEPATSGVSHE
ncbi:MAG: uroporphyrinogen decarboxylase [Planctomycetes bacterium]|nr:uroporphyrinogen decarboxylase [Planctomycetota bacterium]